MALMVVPFEKGQGLLPKSSDGYRGRGTVLPLWPPPPLTSFSGCALSCRSKEMLDLCPKPYVKKICQKGRISEIRNPY